MKRLLGIDYGTNNIGVAVSVADYCQPLTIIPNKPDHPIQSLAIKKISEIVSKERVDGMVFGIPKVAGMVTPATSVIKDFAQEIRNHLLANYNLEPSIYFVDEAWTSKDSLEKAIASDVSMKRRRNDDAIAACEILKRFIDGEEFETLS